MKHSHVPCARAPSIVDKRGKIGFALGPDAQPQRPFLNVLPVVYPPLIHHSLGLGPALCPDLFLLPVSYLRSLESR